MVIGSGLPLTRSQRLGSHPRSWRSDCSRISFGGNRMRGVIAAVLLVLVSAGPVMAQQNEGERTYSLTKILIGAGSVAIGAAVAATSSQTTTVSAPSGASTTSTFSKSQLITGLSVAGVGGIILWNGLKGERTAAPSTTVGVSVAPQARGVFVQRRW
jgi:hypothetical protein